MLPGTAPVIAMTTVLCLRPQADFSRVDALPPPSLAVHYHAPNDAEVPDLLRQSAALVIPAVGPKLAPALFEGAGLKLIQVTGAGLDRLDMARDDPARHSGRQCAGRQQRRACRICRDRRFDFAASLRSGRTARSSAAIIRRFAPGWSPTIWPGIDGLMVGVVGLGTIGLVVAKAFAQAGCHVCYYDPAPADPAAAEAIGAEPLASMRCCSAPTL